MAKLASLCEDCEYYDYVLDDESGEMECKADLDEDDYRNLLLGEGNGSCPYFKAYDEYKTVRKQN